MFVRNGIRVNREMPTGKRGCKRPHASQVWQEDEKPEIDVASHQVKGIPEDRRQLEKKIADIAETLRGYERLIGIKGINPCVTRCCFHETAGTAGSGKSWTFF